MNVTRLLLVFFSFSISGFSAESASYHQDAFQSLVLAAPTESDYARWRTTTLNDRGKPENSELLLKITRAEDTFKRIESLITLGKSFAEYPGLLTLGRLVWRKDGNTFHYVLIVRTHGGEGDGVYMGFECDFDSAMIITRIRPLLSW